MLQNLTMEAQNLNLKTLPRVCPRGQNHNVNVKTDLRYRTYHFSINVIKFLTNSDNTQLYRIIVDQLLRSATSVAANVIEAKSASSKRDFINYYNISLKSANECKYWLCLLRDATEANKDTIKYLLQEIQEISKMLAASVLTMKNKRL